MATTSLASVTLFLPENGVVDPNHVGALIRDLTTEGVAAATHLLVSATAPASLAVSVAAGACYVAQDADPLGPMYRVAFDAAAELDLAAADASFSRIDLIVAEVLDPTYSGTTTLGRLNVVTGVPASTPVAPAIPASAIPLAAVTVAAGAVSVGSSGIVDLREPANRVNEVGRLEMYPTGVIPWGAVALDGGTLQRLRYRRLWAAVSGVTGWGTGDGSTTFTALDMSGRTPIAAGTLEGQARVLGQQVGSYAHLLSADESGLRDHGHVAALVGLEYAYTSGGTYPVTLGGTTLLPEIADLPFTGGVNPSGAAPAVSSHNNMQPSQVMTAAVRV